MTTLTELIDIALDNEVDFEVWHGTTTHADKRTRTKMKIEIAGAPSVVISFGDAKHGRMVSSINLSDNMKIVVKEKHLLDVMRQNKTANQWRRNLEKAEPIHLNLNTNGEDIRLHGVLSSDKTFTVRNFFQGAGVGLYESDPTIYRLVTEDPELLPEVGVETFIEGRYEYPDIIRVNA